MKNGNVLIPEAGEDVGVAQNGKKNFKDWNKDLSATKIFPFSTWVHCIYSLYPHGSGNDNWQCQLPNTQVTCPKGNRMSCS